MEGLMYADSISHSFKALVEVEPHAGVEIVSHIQGKIRIDPEIVDENIIKGYVRLVKSNNLDYFLPVRIDIETQEFVKDLFEGITHLDQSRYNETLFKGKATFSNNNFSQDILVGSIVNEPKYINDIIDGNIDYNYDEHFTHINGVATIEQNVIKNNILLGNIIINKQKSYYDVLDGTLSTEQYDYSKDLFDENFEFTEDTRIRDLYGSASIEPIPQQFDLLEGSATIEVDAEDIDILQGSLKIVDYYSAADFHCRIKVNKIEFIHSIFCSIEVPKSKHISIPCKICVEGIGNHFETVVLNGTISSIDIEQYEKELQGSVTYLPGVCIDIEGTTSINAVHTRKEILDCRVHVVDTKEFELPCTVEVIDRVDEYYYKDIIRSRIIIGNKFEHNISSTIQVQENKEDINNYEYIKYGPRPQSRVVIAVSPTWTYEPFVFKSSLITFLDRYYNKADFSIVFGGSARADFDIINLCHNYKIPKNRLLRVPIEVDFHNPSIIKHSIDHFIYHMFDFKEGESHYISRVFLFMNQPTWYYNDPLAKIAEICVHNQISCVAINAGGEYQELCTIDRARDTMLNNLEYDRQQRMHPNYGFINLRYQKDPNEITY